MAKRKLQSYQGFTHYICLSCDGASEHGLSGTYRSAIMVQDVTYQEDR